MAKRTDRSGNFRQLRLTVTHELPSGKFRNEGRFSWSILAKPLNTDWAQMHVVDRGEVWAPSVPLDTFEDVIRSLVLVLEDGVLPLHVVRDPD